MDSSLTESSLIFVFTIFAKDVQLGSKYASVNCKLQKLKGIGHSGYCSAIFKSTAAFLPKLCEFNAFRILQFTSIIFVFQSL